MCLGKSSFIVMRLGPNLGWVFVRDVFQPIHVCSPCVGIDAPCRWAAELHCQWKSVDIYDVHSDLRHTMLRLHGDSGLLHLGAFNGDPMEVDTRLLYPAEAFVSGPPCQGNSAIGLQGKEFDIRNCVLFHVASCGTCWAKNGSLWFFVLNNVPGLFKKSKNTRRNAITG